MSRDAAKTGAPGRGSAAERIDLDDEGDVARWAKRLCTSPAELREAIAAVGPEVEQVKRHLFVALVRRGGAKR